MLGARILVFLIALISPHSLVFPVSQMELYKEAELDLQLKTVLELTTRPASFSEDGRFLATGGSNSLRIWEVETGQLVRRFQDSGLRGSFSPRGTHLIVSRGDRLELYTPPDFERPSSVVQLTTGPAGSSISSFRVSQNEEVICITSFVGENPISRDAFWIDFLSYSDGAPLKNRYKYGPDHPGPISIAPDGNLVALTKYDRIEIWDWRRNLLTSVLEFQRVRTDEWSWVDPVPVGVEFSTDGRWVATTHPDGTLRLTDLEAPERAKVFRFNAARGAGRAAFSRDGSLMAAVVGGESQRGLLLLYDLQTESVVLRREGRFNLVSTPVFSPDGKFLAVGEGVTFTIGTPGGGRALRETPAVHVYELIRRTPD